METASPLEAAINSVTYPFDRALTLLDDAVILPFYVTAQVASGGFLPRQGHSISPHCFELDAEWRRFSMRPKAGSMDVFSTENIAGEAVSHSCQRLSFVPGNFHAKPGELPLAVPFDARASQRFVLHESSWQLGSGRMRVFGTGRTYQRTGGPPGSVLFGAVQTILEGEAGFAGARGTITWCGTFAAGTGFHGVVTARLYGCTGRASIIRRACPRINSHLRLDPGVTYLLIRGQKPSREAKTGVRLGPNGEPSGLLVHQDLHSVQCDFSLGDNGEIIHDLKIGAKLGTMDSEVFFNLLNPGAPGTNEAPVAFQSRNRITTGRGASPHSTLEIAGQDEGRSFQLTFPEAPGQQALRFGIIGPASGGTGFFQDKETLLMDNSAVTIAPHAVSTLYVLRVERHAAGGGRR